MPTDCLLTITKAAEALGVHKETLRDWAEAGQFPHVRTVGGHRRFKQSDIDTYRGSAPESPTSNERVVVYCRVSSHDQKQSGDLERQVGRVSSFCTDKSYKVVSVLQEVGSGMSDTRPKLHKLFKMVNAHEVDRVVVEHKDRLVRFGFEYLVAYFESHGVIIEWVQETLGKTYEEELVEDILTLMSSFSSRIYGRRSAENRKKKEQEAGS